MTIKLFIRPVPPSNRQPDRYDWALYSYGGEQIGHGESTESGLQELIAQYDMQDVLVHFVVPANDVSYQVATIPAKQSRYVRQALPYAIEESVTEDIEGVHLVLGERLSKEEYPVILINRKIMQRWLDIARSIGLPVEGLYVDAQIIHSPDADLTILFDRDEVLISEPGQSLLRIRQDNLVAYLELRAQQTEEPLKVRILVSESDRDEKQVFLAQLEHVDQVSPEFAPFGVSPFELICESFFSNESLDNLCQGEFATDERSSRSAIRQWWPLAAVASAWFVIQIGLDLTQAYLYRQQAEEYRSQAVAVYKQLFPGERTIASPRRQLQGKLANADSAGQGGDFLSLLGEAGYQLSIQPGKQAMSFNNLQYSEQRGELAIEVKAPKLDDLDRYKQAIVRQGYEVGIGSAIREKDHVRGKITIKGES